MLNIVRRGDEVLKMAWRNASPILLQLLLDASGPMGESFGSRPRGRSHGARGARVRNVKFYFTLRIDGVRNVKLWRPNLAPDGPKLVLLRRWDCPPIAHATKKS